ncbi:hypothetical protein CPB83DRAFT_130057 [Crepidotus variabilis]|uniref:Uncharacterized protein n=1 Tax=Crepidotus variabilis TaxID=179855 RepID=A0A9P6ELT6_9AGAR|nr:hypothetical protein CPB83DRAFT_130057 [Crepidotus variabilis]
MSVKSFASDELCTLSSSESDTEAMTAASTSIVDDPKPSESETMEHELIFPEVIEKPIYTFKWPHRLKDFDSLLPLLRDLPGFTFENSQYHLRGPIPKESQEELFELAETVGRLKLCGTQDYFAPGLLLRLALLRPKGSLFPFLHDLRVEDGTSFLESLSLFLSPALRLVTFSGINEAHEASLVTFLQTAAQEVAGLSIVLQQNQLSRMAIEESIHYGSIQSLHLINSVKVFDYHLIEALGHLRSLKELAIQDTDASAEYRPCAVVLADEEEARVLEEQAREKAEKRLQEFEREEEMKRLEEEARELEAGRLEEVKHLLQEVPHGQELITRLEDERFSILNRVQQQHGETLNPQDERSQILNEKLDCFRMREENAEKRKRQEEERDQADKRRKSEVPQDEQLHPATSSTGECQTMSLDGLPAQPPDLLNTPPTLNIRSSSPEPPEWLSCVDQTDHPFCSQSPSAKLFPTLTHLSVTGSLVLLRDIIGAVSSPVLSDVDIRVVASRGEGLDDASKIAELVAFRWFSDIRTFAFDVGPLDDNATAPTFSNSAFRKLLHSSSITQLQLTGWTIEELEINLTALSQVKPGPSKLQTLTLPCHPGTAGISLKKLGYIAKHCP